MDNEFQMPAVGSEIYVTDRKNKRILVMKVLAVDSVGAHFGFFEPCSGRQINLSEIDGLILDIDPNQMRSICQKTH